jgi:peptidoglycan/xylan/chitin deacetylase (PgdA/CDA1 family)
MNKSYVGASLLAAVIFTADAAAASSATSFDIAITVDDVPAHGALTPGMTRVEIARAYIAALKAHKVPEAYGFVNAVHLVNEPDSEGVLKEWRSAGFPLGSHTYSHRNINEGTVEAFEANILANEPILRKYMKAGDWHYLRFPYLSGGDAAHHDLVNAWLKAHGYRIAEASLGFDDWAYTDPYNRCLAKGDVASVAKLKASYLARVDASIERMKALSQTVYGRLIPQVLVIHIGGFSAVTLPDMLDRLDAAGARYVTLAEAQRDPAYAETDPRAGDGTVMDRAAYEKKIDISRIPAGSDTTAIDQMCR